MMKFETPEEAFLREAVKVRKEDVDDREKLIRRFNKREIKKGKKGRTKVGHVLPLLVGTG